MKFAPLIDELIKAFQCLPGVGGKTAQRMALHLLERNRAEGSRLGTALAEAMEHVATCSICRNLCETEVCFLCADKRRDATVLCVVETPADLISIEQTGGYQGLYFVLSGRLSPIEGIGPEELGLDMLVTQIEARGVKEVILATNPTVEGEATAHYLSELIKDKDITVSRIAHGVPMGGELEYVDSGTLAHALAGRRDY